MLVGHIIWNKGKLKNEDELIKYICDTKIENLMTKLF